MMDSFGCTSTRAAHTDVFARLGATASRVVGETVEEQRAFVALALLMTSAPATAAPAHSAAFSKSAPAAADGAAAGLAPDGPLSFVAASAGVPVPATAP